MKLNIILRLCGMKWEWIVESAADENDFVCGMCSSYTEAASEGLAAHDDWMERNGAPV